MKLTQWQAYFFDLLFLIALYLCYDSYKALITFRDNQAIVVIFPGTISLFAGLGVYGVRIAMYVAMIRHNRMPQTIEWLAVLIGISSSIIFMFFGGTFLDLWGETHGYRRCPVERIRNADAVFALVGTRCPPHWQGRPLD